MPQYKNAMAERAAARDRLATAAQDAGTRAREKGDKYLRNTVLLATVLFLTALAQKFTVRQVRVGLLVVCGVCSWSRSSSSSRIRGRSDFIPLG